MIINHEILVLYFIQKRWKTIKSRCFVDLSAEFNMRKNNFFDKASKQEDNKDLD